MQNSYFSLFTQKGVYLPHLRSRSGSFIWFRMIVTDETSFSTIRKLSNFPADGLTPDLN